ncbi:MAG: serine/threonine protein kinase, partial [Myxococcota bacterium]
MLLLPKKIGSFTLQRKLGTGGIAEAYVGTHDGNAGKPVVVRRVLPYVLRDPTRLASIEARVKDILGVRHPFLVHVVDHVQEGEEHFIVEEYIDGVNLDRVLAWCRQHQRPIPHNVFLNIATQVCNGLEALHGRTGKGTQCEHVLHLALKPGAIFVTRDGKVMVGSYGLTRSPTTLPHGGVAGPVPTRMEYLSPEQTHPDQKLTPASDIFALGALLYELLTQESLFRADSNLQTIHRVRRAEVTTQLLKVKELMPGLDKVLYRALSLNPRHRYQRAFVLREDLRGLMAGYSFATIAEDTRQFLAPLLEATAPASVADAPDAPAGADAFADSPATRIDPDPVSTAAATAQTRAERAMHERLSLVNFDEDLGGDRTESTSPRGVDADPPTEVQNDRRGGSDDLDRPTIASAAHLLEQLPAADVAPPPPRLPDPTASVSNFPPPPMLPLPVHAAPKDPDPASVPETTAAVIAGERPPEDTAAFIARESPDAPPPAPPAPLTLGLAGGSATSTAAFIAETRGEPVAQPPPPPVSALPSPAAAPPAPPVQPAGGPAFSRPMPGPTLSRAMPPPNVASAPKPVPPAEPARGGNVTLEPPSAPPASRPVAATPLPPPAMPAPQSAAAPQRTVPLPVDQPPASGFEEYDPDAGSGGKGWLVGVGAVVALGLVLACAGGGYALWRNVGDGASKPVAATEATAGDAANTMADPSVPRLEPIEEAPVAAATPGEAASPTPVAEAPAPVAAAADATP